MDEDLPRRIFLTGFSGTGKTLVAPLLAEALGWRAIDTDDLIEEAAGKGIPGIFAEDGELRFRELEHEALARATQEEDTVVATGGGALVSVENRRTMARTGLLVCLEASTETILCRLHESAGKPSSERPLLAGDDVRARVEELKARRQPFYALADLIVDTDSLTPPEVARQVAEGWRATGPWAACHPHRLTLPGERDVGAAEPVWVEVPSARYPVYVEWGALSRLGDRMREAGLKERAFIVTDEFVGAYHGERLRLSLASAGFEVEAYSVPPGEQSKTLETASHLYDWLINHRAERGQAIVALGGGMIGDLAGFVAATFLRGVPLVQAPTSLLAMVDAAIGGKVAVDHREAKNLIGSFYQPCLVVEDVSALKTLPRRELVSGFAEIIKHALILDADLLDTLEEHAEDLLHLEPAITSDVLRRSAAIKARVVGEDERETSSLRTILNYGHTVGHALEAATEYGRFLHGEAIAVGMMAAARIGERLGVTPGQVAARQQRIIEGFGLPARAPEIAVSRVLDAVALDKKVESKAVRWVLLEDVGRALIRGDVPPSLVEEVIVDLVA